MKKRELHQTGTCITIVRVGKQPTCAGDGLANLSEGTQVGLLGLVTVSPQQGVHHLVLEVSLQLTVLYLIVSDHLCR